MHALYSAIRPPKASVATAAHSRPRLAAAVEGCRVAVALLALPVELLSVLRAADEDERAVELTDDDEVAASLEAPLEDEAVTSDEDEDADETRVMLTVLAVPALLMDTAPLELPELLGSAVAVAALEVAVAASAVDESAADDDATADDESAATEDEPTAAVDAVMAALDAAAAVVDVAAAELDAAATAVEATGGTDEAADDEAAAAVEEAPLD